MFYAPELRFLKNTFRRCGLQMEIVDATRPLENQMKAEPPFFSWESIPQELVTAFLTQMEANTIYRVSDQFLCNYLALQLPGTEPPQVVVIGPYLNHELTTRQILERFEQLQLTVSNPTVLEREYRRLPVLERGNAAFQMVDAFAEHIWGGEDRYAYIDMERELADALSPLQNRSTEPPELQRTLHDMKIVEEIYAKENELMQAVSQGLTNKAIQFIENLAPRSFEQRLEDPVRNMKNYTIIMNTLLRKAAEQGGVHPIYLDSVSADFARRNELQSSLAGVHELMCEMFTGYCRLVRKHATHRYSPLVQRAIACIDSDLAAELSLKNLAAVLNVNASYLSALFKQETGQTLTEYVQRKRVEMAKQLLKTTKLQIQTIAQSCGFLDIQYFTKVFKKHTQMTPKEFRSMA